MPRVKRWTETDVHDGVVEISLHSWKYFSDYVYQEMLDYTGYIWRGHRRTDWLLESTLDRLVKLRRVPPPADAGFRRKHLEQFKYAARGRRGSNPPNITTENDWWALGQHHGLATPLLDWPTSPFVAAYFAFVGHGPDETSRRTFFALSRFSVEARAAQLQKEEQKRLDSEWEEKSKTNRLVRAAGPREARMPVEFVRPFSDENPRLISQGGLFTRAPERADLEGWVQKAFAGESKVFVLIKISVPTKDRKACLQSLNRMNINHLSLFPDLYGAAKFCNVAAEIDRY